MAFEASVMSGRSGASGVHGGLPGAVWPPVLIVLLVFVVESLLARHWAGMGIYDQYNVIFDTDPGTGTQALAHGWYLFNYNHPLFNYLTALPLRALGKALAVAGLTGDEEAWRQSALLYVIAALTALKSLFLYLSFRLLRLTVWQASAATLIGSLSFGSLVFGAIPDSYALSGTFMALGLWLALRMASTGARWHAPVWWLTGLYAVGTTVSNVIHFGWFNFARLVARGVPPVRAFLGSVGSGAALLALVCGLGYALASASGTNRTFGDETVEEWQMNFLQRHFATPGRALENIARFPERIGRSFVATPPVYEANALARKSGPIPVMSTYNGLPFDLAAAALWLGGLGVCGLGAVTAWRHGGLWRIAGMGALASVASYGLLFNAFGSNTFLYAQYWHTPAMVLVGACLSLPWSRTWPGRILLGAVILGLAAADLAVVADISRQLAAYLPAA